MSLKSLINNQTIQIDDHKWGTGEKKNWDKETDDIHLEKETNFKLDGIRQDIKIKIPLNSQRPIKIQNNKKEKIREIPRRLTKEIKDAFENKQVRESFMASVLNVIENFDTKLKSEERAKNVVEQLAKHFGLDWPEEARKQYVDEGLKFYSQIYKIRGHEYFIAIKDEKIEIGEYNGYAKQQRKGKR